MGSLLLLLLAGLAGAAIAAQATANARLGVLLQHPLAASGFAFAAALVVTGVAVALARRPLPDAGQLAAAPLHLWLVGGGLAAFGVGVLYWLIPQLGVARAVAASLVGQLFFATLAGHHGWFHHPPQPVVARDLLGLFFLVLGTGLFGGGRA